MYPRDRFQRITIAPFVNERFCDQYVVEHLDEWKFNFPAGAETVEVISEVSADDLSGIFSELMFGPANDRLAVKVASALVVGWKVEAPAVVETQAKADGEGLVVALKAEARPALAQLLILGLDIHA